MNPNMLNQVIMMGQNGLVISSQGMTSAMQNPKNNNFMQIGPSALTGGHHGGSSETRGSSTTSVPSAAFIRNSYVVSEC